MTTVSVSNTRRRWALAAAFAGFLLAAFTLTHSAHAQVSQTPVFARISTTATLNVAAGGAINGPVLGLSNVQECVVYADNSAGGANRNLVINFLGPDASTVVYSQTISVTLATRAMVSISNLSGTTSLPTGFTTIPVKPSPWMSFSLASGGAAAGSLAWYCR